MRFSRVFKSAQAGRKPLTLGTNFASHQPPDFLQHCGRAIAGAGDREPLPA